MPSTVDSYGPPNIVKIGQLSVSDKPMLSYDHRQQTTSIDFDCVHSSWDAHSVTLFSVHEMQLSNTSTWRLKTDIAAIRRPFGCVLM